ncbi:Peroxidasin [Amphibalanus amphitrite]|uniref:Peroxidasin n=1 Tax=Amphibalanus amphitrite TaxID=1232801 RepID=A0A6A4WE38_AMPAM|nr:Peroxidasin [Amphibalanus amphitrite]
MAAPALADACPVSCHCRWKGGKKTVECVDRQLESLPTTADTDTQVLDISGHALTELASRAFQRHGLLALQRIYVSRGRLERVGQRALSGLTNLVELDLSENRLTAVPGAALRDVPALRRLSLSGNPLERIQRGDLGAVRELTALELAHCQLRIVEKGAFATLLRLEKLQLQGNQLTTLAAVDLSLHLHNVQLQSNLWHCNCRLRELRRWLRQYPVPLAVPPRCSAPRRLSGRAVHNTSATELACAPDILPSDRLFEVSLNSSVTLSCAAEADPAAELSWWFKGHILKDDPEGVDGGLFITESSELGVDGGGAVRRSQLVIASAGEHDHGVFRCRAANAAGASTADFRVSVLLPPDTRSSGTAPASRSHLALPVGGSLVLLAASALLLLGALAVRRGRRLRRRRKFSTSRDSGSGESAGSPTGGGGGVGSRAMSRDTTLTDCHEHQLHELPRHPPHCARERGPDVLCDASETVTAVTVERDAPPPMEPVVRAVQDLSWPPAWTLHPTMSASHGNIYGPLAPPAGFGDELPAPAALKCGPPPRWAVPGGRGQPGVAPSAVFAARLVAAEKPADSP